MASSSNQPKDLPALQGLYQENRALRKLLNQQRNHVLRVLKKTSRQCKDIEEWIEAEKDAKSARYVGKRIFSLVDQRQNMSEVRSGSAHPIQHVNIRDALYQEKEVGYGKIWGARDDENLLKFLKSVLSEDIVNRKYEQAEENDKAEVFEEWTEKCESTPLAELYELHVSYQDEESFEILSPIWAKMKEAFQGKYSTVSIYARFRMHLHPECKPANEPWTKDEEAALLNFVAKKQKHALEKGENEDEWDWFKIMEVEPLLQDRTPFHCFQHYQRTLNTSEEIAGKTFFTAADDAQLQLLIDEYGTDAVGHIAFQMGDGFSPAIIKARIRKIAGGGIALSKIDPDTDANVNLLFCASEMYGKQYEEMVEHIPGSNACRARDMYDQRLEPGRRRGPWSKGESQILLDFVDEHGPGNWKLVAEQLVGRATADIARQWKTLQPDAAVQYQVLLAQQGEMPSNFVGKEQHRPKLQASDIAMITLDGTPLEEAIADGTDDLIEVHGSSTNKHLNSLNKMKKKAYRLQEKREFKRLESLEDVNKGGLLPLCDRENQVKEEQQEGTFVLKKRKRGRPKKSLSLDFDAASSSSAAKSKAKIEPKQENNSLKIAKIEEKGASADSEVEEVQAAKPKKRSIIEVMRDQQAARDAAAKPSAAAAPKAVAKAEKEKIQTKGKKNSANEDEEGDMVLKKPRRKRAKVQK